MCKTNYFSKTNQMNVLTTGLVNLCSRCSLRLAMLLAVVVMSVGSVWAESVTLDFTNSSTTSRGNIFVSGGKLSSSNGGYYGVSSGGTMSITPTNASILSVSITYASSDANRVGGVPTVSTGNYSCTENTASWTNINSGSAVTLTTTNSARITSLTVTYSPIYYYSGTTNSFAETAMTLSTDGYYYYYGPIPGTAQEQFQIVYYPSSVKTVLGGSSLDAGFNGTSTGNIGNNGSTEWIYCYWGNDNKRYMLLYLPNTTINTSSQYKICYIDNIPLPNDASSAKTVYLDLSEFTAWLNDGANLCVWDGSNNCPLSAYAGDCSNNYLYTAEVSATAKTLYFKRYGSDINTAWNEVSSTSFDSNNLMKVTDWNDGSASVYSAPFTVSFNMNGHGDAPDDQCVSSGGKATAPTKPTADGYVFVGWYENAECTGTAWNFTTNTVTKNLTLYAKWELEYSIRGFGNWSRTDLVFAPNGDGTASIVKHLDNKTSGLTLSGVFKIRNGNDKWFGNSQSITPSANSHTLTETASGNNLTFQFTVEGDYTFNLDYTDPANLVFTVVYPSAYQVSFDANGKTATNMPSATAVVAGQTLAEPAEPSATGYNFTGWYTDQACTQAWSFTNTVNADITLYAKWIDAAPTAVSISGEWHIWTGDNLTLTASASNLQAGATYVWKKNGVVLAGQTGSTLTINGCTKSNTGAYTVTVRNGSQETTSAAHHLKMLQSYLKDNSNNDLYNNVLTRVNETTARIEFELTGNTTYRFNITDGCNNWYGNDGTMTSSNCSNWTFNSSNDCHITTTKTANYIVEVNYSDFAQPVVSVSYPSINQAAGVTIYFDNSDRQWAGDKIYYRIGKDSHNTKAQMTKVPGTANLYKTVTTSYDGFAAWHIANNGCWSDGYSVYKTNTGDGWAATEAIAFQGNAVSSDITIVPRGDHSVGSEAINSNCQFYGIDRHLGLLTHTATLNCGANGSLSFTYTDIDGVEHANVSATTAGLAHTCILTINATPNAGCELATLKVNGVNVSNGGTYVLTADATISATFASAACFSMTKARSAGNISDMDIVGGEISSAGSQALTFDTDKGIYISSTAQILQITPIKGLVTAHTTVSITYYSGSNAPVLKIKNANDADVCSQTLDANAAATTVNLAVSRYVTDNSPLYISITNNNEVWISGVTINNCEDVVPADAYFSSKNITKYLSNRGGVIDNPIVNDHNLTLPGVNNYTTNNSNIVEIGDGKVKIKSSAPTGSAEVFAHTVDQLTNGVYYAATDVFYTISIECVDAELEGPDALVVEYGQTVDLPVFSSGGTISYNNTNSIVATINNSNPSVPTITGHVVGTTYITASVSGGDYCEESLTFPVTVQKTDGTDPQPYITYGADSKHHIFCESNPNTVTLKVVYKDDEGVEQDYTSGTIRWFKNHTEIDGATSATYVVPVDGAGVYSAVVAVEYGIYVTQEITVTDHRGDSPRIQALAPFQYYHIGRTYSTARQKMRHLFAVKTLDSNSGSNPKYEGRFSLSFQKNDADADAALVTALEQAIVVEHSPEASVDTVLLDLSQLSAAGLVANDKITVKCYNPVNACDNSIVSLEKTIDIKVTDGTKLTVAFIVSGQTNDEDASSERKKKENQKLHTDFIRGANRSDLCAETAKYVINPSQELPFYTALKSYYLVTPVNGYACFNIYNYEPFDVLMLTDFVKTDGGANDENAGDNASARKALCKSIVDSLAAIVDFRPVISLKAHMSALPQWRAKGFAANPVASTGKKSMYALCVNHKMFEGNAEMRSYVQDPNNCPFGLVRLTFANVNGYDGDKVIQGFDLGALEGFVNVAIIPRTANTLTQEAIDNNDILVAACERQERLDARFFLVSYNGNAMSVLDPAGMGMKCLIGAVKYIYSPLAESASDCLNEFINTTGDRLWTTAGNWSTGAVPIGPQNVGISADCYLPDGEHRTALNVKMKTGGTLTLAPTASLNVLVKFGDENVGNQASIDPIHNSGSFVLQSSEAGNAAFIHSDVKGGVKATVEMYSTAFGTVDAEGTLNDAHWQWMTTPFTDENNPEYNYWGAWMYRYNNTTQQWDPKVTNGTRMEPFLGYCVSRGRNGGETGYVYSMQGTLASTKDQTLTLCQGLNLIGNSWTAPINIARFHATDFVPTNAEATIVMFNTGLDPTGSGAVAGTDVESRTAGTYVSVPINTASSLTHEELKVIPSMQAFQIRTANAGTLTLDYDRLVRPKTGQTANIQPMRAPSRSSVAAAEEETHPLSNGINERVMITVRGTRYSDFLYLFQHDECTDGFDNGWDGRKYLSDNLDIPMLFVKNTAGNWQVSTQSQLVGTQLGFYQGEDSVYTMSFSYDGDELLYLYDNVAEQYTEIDSAFRYTFTSNTTRLQRRFVITDYNPNATPIVPSTPTDIFDVQAEEDLLVFTNLTSEPMRIAIYDPTGKLYQQQTTSAPLYQVELPAEQGVYLIVAQTATRQEVRKVVR